MGTFGSGLVQGFQGAQEQAFQRQHLDLQKKHLDAQLKQMDVQNQISQLQLQRLMQHPQLAQQLFGMPGQQPQEVSPGVPPLQARGEPVPASFGAPGAVLGQRPPTPSRLDVSRPTTVPGPQPIAAPFLRPGELEQFQQLAQYDPEGAIKAYLARLGEPIKETVLRPGETLIPTRGGKQAGEPISGGPPIPGVHQVETPQGTQFMGVTPSTGQVAPLGEPIPSTKQPSDPYANVVPDGRGGFIGINKKTGRMEQVPLAPGVKAGATFSEDALDSAAERYLLDGTLPTNLGRGTQGAANTANILNRAAQKAKERGMSGEDQRIRQLANKASSSALSQLSAQEAKLRAFEGTFRKNIDLAESLSLKVDRGGTPIFNAWKQAGQRAVAGNPDLVAFDTAIKSVVNEFARITTTATGSGTATAESEIAKMEALLTAAQTPQQFKQVINTMRKETSNRIAAFNDEKKRLRQSFKGEPSYEPSGGPQAGGLKRNVLPDGTIQYSR